MNQVNIFACVIFALGFLSSSTNGEFSYTPEVGAEFEKIIKELTFQSILKLPEVIGVFHTRSHTHNSLSDLRAPTIISQVLELLLPIIKIDPLNPNDTTYSFDSPLLSGNLSLMETAIEGLSTLIDAVLIDVDTPGKPKIQYELFVNRTSLNGKHETDLNILGSKVNYKGQGDYFINLEHPFFKFDFEIQFTETSIEILTLHIDLGFSKMEAFSESSSMNNIPLDWDDMTWQLNLIFETYWPLIRDIGLPLIRKLINFQIKDCNINDLAQGNFECLMREEVSTTNPVTTPAKSTEIATESLSTKEADKSTTSNNPAPTTSDNSTPTTSNNPTPTASTNPAPTTESATQMSTTENSGNYVTKSYLLSFLFVTILLKITV